MEVYCIVPYCIVLYWILWYRIVFVGSALLNCAVCRYPQHWSSWTCDVSCNVPNNTDFGETINYTAIMERMETLEREQILLEVGGGIILLPNYNQCNRIGPVIGWGPYLSRGNCIRILWQKMKCIQILGHKWIHMDSDQINVFSACLNFKTNGNDLVVLINGPINLSFN